MPMIRLMNETMNLIRGRTLPGFRFACMAKERDDGTWDVPVNVEVAYQVATARLCVMKTMPMPNSDCSDFKSLRICA